MAAYQFVQDNIADPLNVGIRKLVITTSRWPQAEERDYDWALIRLDDDPRYSDLKAQWKGQAAGLGTGDGPETDEPP